MPKERLHRNYPPHHDRPAQRALLRCASEIIEQAIEKNGSGERDLSMRRCERIGWIRSIIEHSTDPAILMWEKEHFASRRITNRIYLLLECGDFIVILDEKKKGYYMITAIFVDDPKQKTKHLKAHEEYQKAKKEADKQETARKGGSRARFTVGK